jgi:hypothetical protein
MNESNPDPLDQAQAETAPPAATEERYNRIAEAAYLRAASRGFVGGDPMQDWLDAEADLMKSAESDPAEQAQAPANARAE